MKSTSKLDELLQSLSPFIYLPNQGNYGDLLIHESVRQKFRGLGVDYKLYNQDNLPDKFNLVFCGAGQLIPQWINHFNIDISTEWTTSGYDMPFHANMIKCFADAVKTVDVVVTDRLHVAIMAWHSGREVYMLDNSYKKLSGVYELSLKHDAKVHLLEDGRLTPELDAAWARFNLEKQ